MKKLFLVVTLVAAWAVALHAAGAALPACGFLSGSTSITPPTGQKSVLIDNYFRIFYSPDDKAFHLLDASGQPAAITHYQTLFERSHHFLQTELGWKMPATTTDLNRPELNIYFVTGPREFAGTVRKESGPEIFLNSRALSARDFAALWIHQLAHAAELQYKTDGDAWFYEATAGWMEGQFDRYSRSTEKAVAERMNHPEIPLFDADATYALGNLRLLQLLARPYKDIIRQIWERWSQPTGESLLQVIESVLALNHLPQFQSYLQNYFLLFNAGNTLDDAFQDVSIAPYSAFVAEKTADNASGGVRLAFTPSVSSTYSASLLYYGPAQKSGTLAMKTGLHDSWSILVPFAGLDHYKLVVINNSASDLQGSFSKSFDTSIPAVLQYFRVNPGEGGVQIEWKTTKENGVAFWNLYKIHNGQKELLNAYPIPAAINSDEGIHYLFVDTSSAAYYSLEAVTSEGFGSALAGSNKPR